MTVVSDAEMLNQRFGRLVVQGRSRSIAGNCLWLCLCDCGAHHEVRTTALRTGNTRSCGCLARDVHRAVGLASRTHGMLGTSEYRIWVGMKGRCNTPTSKDYPNYGGRGIKVCPEWESFERFYADMGPRPKGTTLDRKENDGDYCKDNCRWATVLEQNRNRSCAVTVEIDGKPLSLQELSEQCGVSYSVLHNRIVRRRWSIERATTTPVQPGRFFAKSEGGATCRP